MKPVVVLGAGLAGLGAARKLEAHGTPVVILEQGRGVGGLAQTDTKEDFLFDRTGHFLHFKSPELLREIESNGVQLDHMDRRAAVMIGETQVPYPIQYNGSKLAPEVQEDILRELTEPGKKGSREADNFGDYLEMAWGETLCRLFFRPYNEKLWGRPLAFLPPDCAGRYLPEVDVALVEAGCRGINSHFGYNSTFYYPSSGRIGDCAKALAAPVKDSIYLNERVTLVDLDRGICGTDSGREYPFSHLINTAPLPAFLRLCGMPVPEAQWFSSTAILNVRVGFVGKLLCRHHWIYVPDKEIPYYRIGFPPNVNDRTCPPGTASLSIEFTLANGETESPPPVELARHAMDYLSDLGMIEVQECLFVDNVRIEPAYVVFRSQGRQYFQSLTRRLEKANVHLAGRYGVWDYMSMEEAYHSGTEVACRVYASLSQGSSACRRVHALG